MTPVLSVVDYDAWRRDYMPPTEHQLIHSLSNDTAKVILSADNGRRGYWIVTRDGQLPDRKALLAIFQALEVICEDEDEEHHPLAAERFIATTEPKP